MTLRAQRDGAGLGVRRAAIAVLLPMAMAVSAFPVYAISALSPHIVEDLGLSRVQLGSITTVVFLVALVTSLPFGALVDGVGRRRVLMILCAAAGTALWLLAGADTYAWVLAAAALTGLALAASNPATNAVLAQDVRGSARGVLTGVKQSGVQMGQVVAGTVLPALALYVGWRVSTLSGVVLAAMTVVLVVVFVSHAPGGPPAAASADGSAGTVQSLRWLYVCIFLFGVVVQATNAYLPLYAFEEVGMTVTRAGSLVGVIGAVGVASRILLSRAGERADNPVRLLAAVGFSGAVAMAGIAAASAVGPLLVPVAALLYAATAVGSNGLMMLLLIKAVGRRRVGHASGVGSAALFAGFATGPMGFGLLVDVTRSYVVGWVTLALMCAAAGVAARVWESAARDR